MPSPRADRALLALLIGFAVLAVAVVSSIWLAQRQQEAFGSVKQTLETQNQIAAVLSDLQDAETGQRGFLLTGRPEFLDPHYTAVADIGVALDLLDVSVADNPAQAARARKVRGMIEYRIARLRRNVEAKRRGDPIEVSALATGRLLMDDIRANLAAMTAEEQRLLVQRAEAARRQDLLINNALIASGLATLALGVFALHDGRRRVGVAISARDALALSNEQLKTEAANRQAAETQVRQLQKMEAVGQLTGGIAHDFNNMLAVILGSLDMAKRRLTMDPRRAEAYIDNAIEGAERAAQLTGRLLAFSRQQPLAPRAMDVNRLVGGMSELLRHTIGEHLRVETVLAGDLWRAYADPGQLENAILNLCVNARDAMPEGGRLIIETSNAQLDDAYAAAHPDARPGEYVMISVSDTGSGMPAEVAARAFDPFFTTKGVGRGTGLGLSQVHGFVKQSGGHVNIYSEPGVGTTVRIYLPRRMGRDKLEKIDTAPPRQAPRACGEEIVLVVEDEERVRDLSVDTLRELGYTVVQAADANQALAVLSVQPRVDLLFTDIVMPDMNGRRLADKALEGWPHLKVLYTTGYTRNAIVHNGVLDANVALLPKPFTMEQLAVKVRQVFDGKGANRVA